MARKVPPKPEPDGQEDLAILHPEQTLTIAGREITVREYGFIEGLAVRTRLADFQAALESLLPQTELLLEDVLDLVTRHQDAVIAAMAQSANVEPAWIAGLSDKDGYELFAAWWSVCSFFFVRPYLRRAVERLQRRSAAGATSTSPSLPQASEPPPNSAATPNDNSDSSINASSSASASSGP